jgi:Pyruvate/2-oxoacid:ferredoxin oxidoreductase delta subunit
MGHLASMGIYQSLQQRLDGNPVGAPPSELLFNILSILFKQEEAEIAAKMPYGFASTGRLSRITGIPEEQLRAKLDAMAEKGLVFDLVRGEQAWWYLNPLVIGFFEFTMMRVRTDIDQTRVAHMLHEYLFDDPVAHFIEEVSGGRTTLMRPMVHEADIAPTVEVLDYERASHLIRSSDAWSMGICYCRHSAQHRGKPCKFPMDLCLSFGHGARYLVRHRLARSITKEESLEALERARGFGMVQIADNVRERGTFMCNCCSCCCGMLEGYRRLKDSPHITTSSFLPAIDAAACTRCGKCAKACPVAALELKGKGEERELVFTQKHCLGCGVCATTCSCKAISMQLRGQRVIPPSDTVEKLVRMALERGKLQHLLFDDPARLSHKVLRAVLKALLKLPPGKQLLASQQVESIFLRNILKVARRTPGTREL